MAKKSARKPNAAFMKPVTPDAKLAAVVGSSPYSRLEPELYSSKTNLSYSRTDLSSYARPDYSDAVSYSKPEVGWVTFFYTFDTFLSSAKVVFSM